MGPTVDVHSSSASTEYGIGVHISPRASENFAMWYSLSCCDVSET